MAQAITRLMLVVKLNEKLATYSNSTFFHSFGKTYKNETDMRCVYPGVLVTLGIRLIAAICHAYEYENRNPVSTFTCFGMIVTCSLV